MQQLDSFTPKWAIPPGATIRDLLHERGLDVAWFADQIHRDRAAVTRLLSGLEPLTPELAEQISQTLGATPTFWLRREEHYRSDLKTLCGATSRIQAEEWLRDLPLTDMVRFGWISEEESVENWVGTACAFFGISTPGGFHRRYRSLESSTAYRTSTAYPTRPSALAAWLRQGEISATEVACKPWDVEKLHESLQTILGLTKEPDPSVFIPRLQEILAGCGVALVVARAPSGCRASGATRFLEPDKALIQISFRYLSDDQLWFTVFHEIGHLVLHTEDGLFLEGLEDRSSNAETEADAYALENIFVNVGVDALRSVPISMFAIARLARRAGVSPGLVVGQLQKLERIPYSHFNQLKARYTWGE